MRTSTSFFYSQEHDLGAISNFTVELGTQRYLIGVYSARPFKTSLLKDARFETQDEYGIRFQEIREAILEKGRGGLIVIADGRGRDRAVLIEAVAGLEYLPPTRVLLLRAGHRPEWRGMDGERIELSSDSHLVIPVHENAHDRLSRFLDDLAWFSADLEAVVLSAIRRPSVDARLERLELEVFDRGLATGKAVDDSPRVMPARDFNGQLSGAEYSLEDDDLPGKPPRLYAVRRILAGIWSSEAGKTALAGALVIALLLLGWVFLREAEPSEGLTPDNSVADPVSDPSGSTLPPSSDVAPPADDPVVATPPATHTPPPAQTPPALPATDPLVDAMQNFFGALEPVYTQDPNLMLLFDIHFKLYSGAEWNDVTWSALEDKTFIWGIIKAQALKLMPNPDSDDFLKHPKAFTATKNVFRRIGDSRLREDREGLLMISALACKMGYDTPDGPGLPETGADSSLRFMPDSCSKRKDEEIVAGLNNLAEFIKTYKAE